MDTMEVNKLVDKFMQFAADRPGTAGSEYSAYQAASEYSTASESVSYPTSRDSAFEAVAVGQRTSRRFDYDVNDGDGPFSRRDGRDGRAPRKRSSGVSKTSRQSRLSDRDQRAASDWPRVSSAVPVGVLNAPALANLSRRRRKPFWRPKVDDGTGRREDGGGGGGGGGGGVWGGSSFASESDGGDGFRDEYGGVVQGGARRLLKVHMRTVRRRGGLRVHNKGRRGRESREREKDDDDDDDDDDDVRAHTWYWRWFCMGDIFKYFGCC
ncbi:hypothetical protein CBR_g55548 [Chara braunii]|uniref:Uncharacterized protein n=1 Tax=Chara braunii TaxID=69332 RepID=A0A388MDC4_CHABU|nr:hypothetical protein CBR_g55548 [Chara braunii]|eukprot:GBG92469.1 hypothetical protein CBR_g55548 [Chara braunii]